MTSRPYIIIVSSAPPTPCGLATFTAALRRALVHHGARVGILRVLGENDDTVTSDDALHTIGTLRDASPDTMSQLRRQLDEADLVLVQHEYGLYGGHDGDDILTLMNGVRTPMVAILHTVLPRVVFFPRCARSGPLLWSGRARAQSGWCATPRACSGSRRSRAA